MGSEYSKELQTMCAELARRLLGVYGDHLRAVILYGSVARGTQTQDSDVDILVLADCDAETLRTYEDSLSDVAVDLSLQYGKVLSIVDVSYDEYMQWRGVSPFYRNVSQEGVVLYAA